MVAAAAAEPVAQRPPTEPPVAQTPLSPAALAQHAPPVDPLASHDPVSTVRLSRDRILRALAEEPAAPPVPTRARSESGTDPQPAHSPTRPPTHEESAEVIDPVAIAAAAIARLRNRARTDFAELRIQYHRHDIIVLVVAFVIIAVAGRMHARLVTPPRKQFAERGLSFERSDAWLAPIELPLPAPRIAHAPPSLPSAKKDDAPYFIEMTSSADAAVKIDVFIDKKPAWSNIVTGLELDRRTRWGELYSLDAPSESVSIDGHGWLRTAYHYAHGDPDDLPRVDRAIEYATVDRDQMYVVTILGPTGGSHARALDEVEAVLSPSLRVASRTGMPIEQQRSRVTQHNYPRAIERAFESTVMVVVADLVDGRLRPRGGGSGVIVGADGSILTNYHVVHDKDGRLHDVFVIGRSVSPDRPPQLVCAGKPSRSKLQRELDLALVKCDTDLDGRSWLPSSGGMVWATLDEGRSQDVKMGQRLWVIGYPDKGGGGLTLYEGEVEGWTGDDGAPGRDFIKTDASITHGNSGGPVVDDQGKLIGIASAFRTRTTAGGGVIETTQVGLVRPLSAASAILAYATGWTPLDNHNDVDLAPTSVEAAAVGVRIWTTVVDHATDAPVRDALVIVLRPGVDANTIDMNRLDDQAIAWGRTNARGEVRLKQPVPVPGTYSAMVIAPGYEPELGVGRLDLKADTPANFDPWGEIRLRAR
jgi:V8-like Glu-specific endopeptidase